MKYLKFHNKNHTVMDEGVGLEDFGEGKNINPSLGYIFLIVNTFLLKSYLL